jgi:perosamine synthetase
MNRFYHIAPAGTPITVADVAAILGQRISGQSEERLSESIRQLSSSRYCYFFNSGRSALYYSLLALSKIVSPNRNRVIIPAYTCFSVASAVVRAGLKIELVDIVPDTLDYDYEKLLKIDPENILAIVGCNLLGVLNNWEKLHSFAESSRCFLIDDAAQSMGSSVNGNQSGSLGDLGFYSLGRGKNLSAYAGGILVTDNENISEGIRREIESLPIASAAAELKAAVEIGFYGAFLRPWLYWIPNSIPFLHLGETTFDPDFALGGLSHLQQASCLVLLTKLELLNETRSRNALNLGNALLLNDQIRIPGFNIERPPIYLRLPLLLKSKQIRDLKLHELRNRGIMASTMYPSTIRMIPGIEKYLTSGNNDYSGADEIVERLLTVPTHSYLNAKSMRNIISVLNNN